MARSMNCQSTRSTNFSCVFNDADLLGSPYRNVLQNLVHVTDTNDEAWLSDMDLYSVCKLFGTSATYGEFVNTWKILLRKKQVNSTSKNLRAIGFPIPAIAHGLSNVTKTKCYANVIVVLLWRMKFAHDSLGQTDVVENQEVVHALREIFSSLDGRHQADLAPLANVLMKHNIWEISDTQQNCAHSFWSSIRHRLGAFEQFTKIEQETVIRHRDILVSQRSEILHDLNVDIIGHASIQSALHNYLQERDIMFEPEPNFGEALCREHTTLKTLPTILVINTRRFHQNECGQWIKHRGNVSIETEIRLLDSEYCLFAVIIHSGNSQTSGHYEILVNECMRNHWNLYNDARVNRVQATTQLSKLRGGYRTAQYLVYVNKDRVNDFFPLNDNLQDPQFGQRKRQKITVQDFIEISDTSDEAYIEDDVDMDYENIDDEMDIDIDEPSDAMDEERQCNLAAAIEVDDNQFVPFKPDPKLKASQVDTIIKFRFVNGIREWLIRWKSVSSVQTNWFMVSDLSQECKKKLTAYLRSNRVLLQQGWKIERPSINTDNANAFDVQKQGATNKLSRCNPLEAFETFFSHELQQQIVDEMNNFALLSPSDKQKERIRLRSKQLDKLHVWARAMELKYPALKDHKAWCDNLSKIKEHYLSPPNVTKKQRQLQRKSCRAWRRKPLTLGEFRTFLGITITIIIVKGRRIKDYWTENNARFGNEWISSRMTYERYQMIWKNFHYDVEWLISSLREKYQSNWSPSQHVTFDETIVPFLGKFFAKQYIPSKPHPNGILLYMLADAKFFVWDIDVYLGLCLPPKYQLLEIADKLAKQNREFIITTDSKWGSEEVARSLDERGLHFLLSAKKNSPSYLFDHLQHELAENSVRSCYAQGQNNVITATSFHDQSATMNLFCNYISDNLSWRPTCPKVTIPGQPSPTKQIVNPRTICKPLCAQEYAYAKGFVDEAARQLHTFSWPHRFQKWTQALFSSILGLTMWNSFIYFKSLNTAYKGNYRLFLEQLSNQLGTEQCRSPKKPSKLKRLRNSRGRILKAAMRMVVNNEQLHLLVPAKYFCTRTRGWCKRCPKSNKNQTTLMCLGCSLSGAIEFQCTRCSKGHVRVAKLFK